MPGTSYFLQTYVSSYFICRFMFFFFRRYCMPGTIYSLQKSGLYMFSYFSGRCGAMRKAVGTSVRLYEQNGSYYSTEYKFMSFSRRYLLPGTRYSLQKSGVYMFS